MYVPRPWARYGNAVMENFFGHLKAEMYHGEVFDTVTELTQAIDEYGLNDKMCV